MTLSANQQRAEIDQQVRQLFGRSPAMVAMPTGTRDEILRDTSRVVQAMVQQRLGGSRPADPFAVGQASPGSTAMPSLPGASGGGGAFPQAGVDPSQFTGGATTRSDSTLTPKKAGDFGTAIATGVGQAGELLRQVNFTAFVGELIRGVFQAIVDATVQQMQAYAELVKSVTMSLSDFRDENVTENQARDHLVGRYPNLLQLKIDQGQPKVALRPDAQTDSLPDFAADLGMEEGITDIDDETIEQKLVPAARNDIARGRQQLLATVLMMGINRIVVTNGKINAKLKFNFSASDQMSRSATNYDMQSFGTTTAIQRGGSSSDTENADLTYNDAGKVTGSSGGARRWTTGDYQYAQTPAIQVTGITQEQTEAALSASAQLAGSVDINFKSDTVDLNQFVSQNDIFRIAQARGAGRAAPGTAAVQPTPGGTPPTP